MKRGWLQLGKTLVSLFLLGWLLVQIKPQAFFAVIASAQLDFLGLSLIVMVVGLLVSVHKWRALLVCDGFRITHFSLVRYYLIGIYCNNFLPTSVGGDAMRAWLVASRCGSRQSAIASVLAERFSGLLVLLLVAGFLSLDGSLFPMQRSFGLGLLVILLLMAMISKGVGLQRFLKFLPNVLSDKIGSLLSALSRYCRDRRSLWAMGWASMIYPLLVGLVYYWAARALMLEVSLFDLVVISSIVTLLTLIPISLNGLGLREGSFVYFLGLLGVPQAQAISLPLLVFAFTLLFSFAGGVCLLFERRRAKAHP